MGKRNEIREREFEVNAGFCDDCRDGRKDGQYRQAREGHRGRLIDKRTGKYR